MSIGTLLTCIYFGTYSILVLLSLVLCVIIMLLMIKEFK